jgi:hypothetical protein
MRAIEILRNGSMLCVAGTASASLLSVHVNLFIEEPHFGTLRVSGMNELENERSSHTYWLEDESLGENDRLTIRFTESDHVTPPGTETATDSEQYIAEQKWYEGEVKQGIFEPREVQRTWPNGWLSLATPGSGSVVATFEGEREFITFSLSWNQWRKDVCRFSLSSFSQSEAVARAGSKQWFEGKLKLEECCEVRLGS